MRYSVKARFDESGASAFFKQLTDGTIETQKPDGREIIASMQRAKIDAQGVVRWNELCYCPTPLEHERQTVYDHFFSDFEAKESQSDENFEGQPFMEYLRQLAT